MHRLWAEKMDALYTTVSSRFEQTERVEKKSILITTVSDQGKLKLLTKTSGILSLYTLSGQLIERSVIEAGKYFTLSRARDCLIVEFRCQQKTHLLKVAR
jgi:hypothetical protein